MHLWGAVRAIAVLASGVFAGIMFGDRVGPSFSRPILPAASFIVQQQIIHKHYIRILPPLSLAAVLSVLLWLILLRREWNAAEFSLVAVAAAAIVIAAVLTLRVNFPINDQLMNWNAASPPANFREIWATWENVHTIRTVLWLGAFALEVVALTIFASRNPGAGGN